MPRDFALSEVLTMTTEFMLCERKMVGLRDLMGYVVSQDLTDIGVICMKEICREALIAQHPILDSDVLRLMTEKLAGSIDAAKDQDEVDRVIGRWLVSLRPILGESLSVVPIDQVAAQ